jgi:adenylylsulfate kinase
VLNVNRSGKSVVSEALLQLLEENGVRAQLLSSDRLRKVMTPQPTYSLEERDIIYGDLVYIAKLLTRNGVNVIIDATGNLRCYRDQARKQIPRFIEAYLKCPMNICVEREQKRRATHLAPRKIYSKALRGQASTVPGIGQPYEEPLSPEIVLDGVSCSPKECAEKIFTKIEQMNAKREKR